MSSIKGITIKIGANTLNFDNSVRGVQNALKALRLEATEVNKELKVDPDNIQKLNKKLEISEQQMKLLREKAASLREELLTVDTGTKKYNRLQNQLLSVEKQLKDATAAAAKTKHEINELGDSNSVKSLSNKFENLKLKLGEVNEKLKLDPNNIVLLKQKSELLGESLQTLKAKLTKLKEEQKNVAEGSAEWKRLQTAINGVQANISDTEKEMNALNKALDTSKMNFSKISAAFNEPLDKLKHNLDNINAKLKFDSANPELLAQKMKALEAVIGTAENKLDLLNKTASRVSKQDMAAYKKEVRDTDSLIVGLTAELNSLKNAAKNSGQSFEQMNAKLSKPLKEIESQLSIVNQKLKFDSGNANLVAEKMKLLSQAGEAAAAKLEKLRSAVKLGNVSDIDKYKDEIVKTERQVVSFKGELNNLQKAAANSGKSFVQQVEAMKSNSASLNRELELVNSKLRFDSSNAGLASQRMNLLKNAASDARERLAKLRAMADSVDSANMDNYQREIHQTQLEIINLEGELKSTANTTSKLDNAVSSNNFFRPVIWSTVFNLVQNGLNSIRNLTGDTIERVDTLNRFPRTMETLGFSSEKASESMKRMKLGIEGLPTKLDEMTAAVITISSTVGDLDRGTDIALAFNNAMNSYGATGEHASDALRQFSQSLGMGKIMAEEFNSMAENAPGFMNKMAEAFGFGKNGVINLKTALREGKITVQDFANKLVEVDKAQGGFAQMAKSSSVGISTSLRNVRTAFINTYAEVINAVNNSLKANGFGTINEMLDRLKERIKASGAVIVSMVNEILKVMSAIRPAVSLAFDGISAIIGTALGLIGPAIKESINLISAHKEVFMALAAGVLAAGVAFETAQLATKLQGIFSAVSTAVTTLVTANPVLLAVVATIGAVAAALTYFFTQTESGKQTWSTLVQMFNDFVTTVAPVFNNVWTTIKDAFVSLWTNIQPVLSSFMEYLGPKLQTIITQLAQVFITIFTSIATVVNDNMSTISAIISTVMTVIQTVIQVAIAAIKVSFNILSGVLAFIGGAFGNMQNIINNSMSAVISIINSAINIVKLTISTVMALITGDWKTAWSNIKQILSELLSIIITALSASFTNMIELLKGTINGINAVFNNFATNMFNSIKTFISNVINAVKNWFANLVSSTSAFINTVINLAKNLMTSVQGVINNMITSVITLITHMVNSVINLVKSLMTTFTNIITSLKNTVVQIVTQLVNSAVSLFNNLKTAVANIVSNLFSALTNTFNNIKNAIVSVISNMVNNITGLVRELPSRMINAVSSIGNVGRKIASDIFNNVSSLPGRIVDIFRSLPERMGNAIGDLSYIGRRIINQILSGLSDLGNRVSSHIKSSISHIGNIFKGKGVNVSQNFMQNGLASGVSGYLNNLSLAVNPMMVKQASGVSNSTTNTTNNFSINITGVADGTDMLEAKIKQVIIDAINPY